MKPRVVVTGIGAVSPNGIGREAFWSATRQGISGVRRISSFDPSGLNTQIAGEIVNFNPLEHISEKDSYNVSRVAPLAIAAAREAVADAGLDAASMPNCKRLANRNMQPKPFIWKAAANATLGKFAMAKN